MAQQLQIGDLVTSDAVRLVYSHVKKKKARRGEDKPEDIFDYQLRQARMPAFVRDVMFAKHELGRFWRFDFCWQKYMVAVEIEGLVVRMLIDPKDGKRVRVVYGRHATVDGFREDTHKYNNAALLRWTVLRFEASDVGSKRTPGHALEMTMRVLADRGWAR